MTPFQCDFLSKQGFESFVVSVGKDSHYLIGSPRGKSFLVERTFLVTDFILYCKGKHVNLLHAGFFHRFR